MHRQLERLRKEKSINVSAWLRQLVQQELDQVFPDYEAAVATEGPEQPPDRVADGRENDQTKELGVATEATQTASQTTPAETAETPQHDSNTSPIVATESLGQENPEQPEQPPDRVADGRENDQTKELGVATEATQTASQTTPAETAETPQHDSNTSPIVATESLGQENPEQPEQPPDRVADGRENDQTKELGVATEATQTASQTTPAETAETPQHDPNTSPIVAAQDTAQMTPIPGWKPRKLNGDEWGAALEGEMVAELPDNEQLPGTRIVVTDKRGESWTPTLTEVVDRTDNTIVVKNSGRPRS